MKNKQCSVCGKTFNCGVSSGQNVCWCNEFPPFMPANYSQDCRCPSCLAQAIATNIHEKLKLKSTSQMLEIAAPFREDTKLIEYIDYVIENGCYVFSQWYLLKRGYCCGNGCRNCPY